MLDKGKRRRERAASWGSPQWKSPQLCAFVDRVVLLAVVRHWRAVCVQLRVSLPSQLAEDFQEMVWHHRQPRISTNEHLHTRGIGSAWNRYNRTYSRNARWRKKKDLGFLYCKKTDWNPVAKTSFLTCWPEILSLSLTAAEKIISKFLNIQIDENIQALTPMTSMCPNIMQLHK